MLFDDNLGFFGFSIPKEVNMDLTSIEKGFARGNMFNNLYDPYKDYNVKMPMATNEFESMLFDIMAISFVINDLNLYLDLHPDDKEMLERFVKYAEMSYSKEMEFVRKYGPLEVLDSTSLNKFEWINNPWPWENDGGSKYV